MIKTCMSVNGEDTSNLTTGSMLTWANAAINDDDKVSLTLSDMESCTKSGGSFKQTTTNGETTYKCECGSGLTRSADGKTCGYKIIGGVFTDNQTKFVTNVVGADIQLPPLSSWNLADDYKAHNCYYVYQSSGDDIKKAKNNKIPVDSTIQFIHMNCSDTSSCSLENIAAISTKTTCSTTGVTYNGVGAGDNMVYIMEYKITGSSPQQCCEAVGGNINQGTLCSCTKF
jgi:hypothetical protein